MKINIEKIFLLIWIITLLGVFIGSVSPQVHMSEEYHLDKFIHGSAYAFIAFMAYMQTKKPKVFLAIMVILIIIGGGIEIIQTYIPTRSGDIPDFIADCVGIFAGALLAKKLKPIVLRWFNN